MAENMVRVFDKDVYASVEDVQLYLSCGLPHEFHLKSQQHMRRKGYLCPDRWTRLVPESEVKS